MRSSGTQVRRTENDRPAARASARRCSTTAVVRGFFAATVAGSGNVTQRPPSAAARAGAVRAAAARRRRAGALSRERGAASRSQSPFGSLTPPGAADNSADATTQADITGADLAVGREGSMADVKKYAERDFAKVRGLD